MGTELMRTKATLRTILLTSDVQGKNPIAGAKVTPANGARDAVNAAIPEPSTLAPGGMGAPGLIGVLRRHRRG